MNAFELLALVVLPLLVAALCDWVIATRKTIPSVRKLVADDARTILAEELAKALPGAMRGGHDPRDLAAIRLEKAEERRAEAARTHVEIKTFLAERFGPERVSYVFDFLGDDLTEQVVSAGKRWRFVLEPLLLKLPARLTDKPAEPVNKTPYLQE